MRNDLEHALRGYGIALQSLAPLLQILLTTDGTVTDILEACAGEPMHVVKLDRVTSVDASPQALELDGAENLMQRHILLEGRDSHRRMMYAHSTIVVDRLDPRVRDGLLNSRKPLGLLLLERRVETFKEILDAGRRPAGDLAAHFHLPDDAPLIHRSYRMISGGRPLMRITEMFPEQRYRDWQAPAAAG